MTIFLKFLLVFTTISGSLFAADSVMLYSGSCQKDLGIILRADRGYIDFLSYKDGYKKVPRYDVVGLSIYSLPNPPIKAGTFSKKIPISMFRFLTFRNEEIIPLAVGWPIEYNADNIQILTASGQDILVNRNEIWGVERAFPKGKPKKSEAAHADSFRLLNPLYFRNCPVEIIGTGVNTYEVAPIEEYTNAIRLKRHLDRLKAGYDQILDYEDRQRFYAVPQYYKNVTRMGTFAVINSRTANVGARQSNFLPFVEDELSEGPFGFQRVIRSGLFPIDWTTTLEPNVQALYALKADYIILEIFFDPMRTLIGDKYRWKKDQLDTVDERLIESGGMEFGFDFGYAALKFSFTSGESGIRVRDNFANVTTGVNKVGFDLQYNRYNFTLLGGSKTSSDYDSEVAMKTTHFIVDFPVQNRFLLKASMAVRKVDYENRTDRWTFKSENTSFSLFVNYQLNHRWRLYALPVIEQLKVESEDKEETYFTLASGLTISF